MNTIILLDDIELLAQWRESEWIGQKKTYPTAQTPSVVLAARRQVLSIPPDELDMFPSPLMSVASFLEMDLPAQPTRLVFEKPETTFRHELPTETLQGVNFQMRPIPPKPFIEKLEQSFGQAWFDGAHSIVDSRYKQSRLPLYVLTYWREMSRVLEKGAKWRLTSRWLNQHVRRQEDLVNKVHALLEVLPWGADLRAYGAATTTDTLALLLSNAWLDDELIDMLSNHLASRIRRDPHLTSKVAVATLSFQHCILASYTGKNPPGSLPAFLYQLKQRIVDGVQRLYFPVNLDNAHWVAFCIDFETRTICHGPAKTLVKAIRAWSHAELSIELRDRGNTLTHGLQTDSSSCGLCTINTLAHNIFEDPLYRQKDSASIRMEYFCVLAQAQLELGRIRRRSEPSQLDERPCKRAALEVGEVRQGVTPTSSNRGTSRSQHAATSNDGKRFERAASSGDEHLRLATDSKAGQLECADGSGGHATSDDGGQSGRPACDDMEERPVHQEPKGSKSAQATADDSDEVSTHEHREETIRFGAVGISRSATDSRELKLSFQNGTASLDPGRLKDFLEAMASLDPFAEIREDKQGRWQVWHSRCARWYYTKGPYSVTRFRNHVNFTCKVMQSNWGGEGRADGQPERGAGKRKNAAPAMRTRTLVGMAEDSQVDVDEEPNHRERPPLRLSVSSQTLSQRGAQGATLPCSGISERVDERIPVYLRRTFVSGAGSRSSFKIAQELFQKPYKDLDGEAKGLVDSVQAQERSWRIDLERSAVFATGCKRFLTSSGYASGDPKGSLCRECHSVYMKREFKTALRAVVNRPETVKYKHINKRYQNETLGHLFARSKGLESLILSEDRKATVYARLASGILDGKLSGYPIVGDLLEALAENIDREERGVGKQNFKYGPSLTQFANMCAIVSPELYRILAKHLPLPTLRQIRRTQNSIPRFPLSVCEETFLAVSRYLSSVRYSGPVALSCDDTKLHAAFRTYWDAAKQVHILVGGTDEPRAVANPKELQNLLEDSESEKSTKVRLWCVQVPLPKIPPIVVAAKAIPNSLTVIKLHDLIVPIIRGLLALKTSICSYACDGTETERSLQRLLVKNADHRFTYTIPHPYLASGEPIVVEIAVYDGHAIVMIQDSKHALKTLRNNLFSGARLLTFGNDVAMYGWARLLAFLEDSPLYNRDVEKVDRQDDNAATRLFSATTLEYLTSHHPERVGQIVYLFVMGELVDAYQNRHIPHVERVKMALRARFFLEGWRAYLKAAQYPESRHFISREAADICTILIDGLIGLIICRKLVKDFTFLDLIYMIPRLHVLLRSIINFAHSSDPKARASGYAHSYFDTDNIDLSALATFPCDDEIQQAARDAWQEAESLMLLVGIVPSDVMGRDASRATTQLPSISSWYPASQEPQSLDSDTIDDDNSSSDEDYDCNSDSDDSDEDESAVLQRLITEHQNDFGRSNAQDERFLNLTCAAVALAMDDTVTVYSASEVPDSEQERQQHDDRHAIQQAFEAAANNLLMQLPPEPMRPFDRPAMSSDNVDYTPVITTRRQHETKRAARCVRTSTKRSDLSVPGSGVDKDIEQERKSQRSHVIREMDALIRQYNSNAQGVGTGLERRARWHVGQKDSGNTVNAALAAGQRAASILSQRIKTFGSHALPNVSELADALIGVTTPKTPRHFALCSDGSFGLVFHESQVLVGRVLAVYSQEGGKNGKHAWCSSITHIGHASYIAVQLYEQVHTTQFRAILRRLAPFQTFAFALVSGECFLRLLPGDHQFSLDRRTLSLHLDSDSERLLAQLQTPEVLAKLTLATKALRAQRRKNRNRKQEAVGGEDSGSEDGK
ncbi:hypothetical protein GY45DRAFT_1253214 [Cubamyces sp. BRFM 1775]|nr:hypothetical protein GY45DRAFT_1253214 [Cubamyces sp. BRFM 1775]